MTEKRKFAAPMTLSDEIADIVRDRILRGEYRIGEKIKETVIAEELTVSRTPIREAFKQLESEGLIDYIPNRGCFAKGFTRQDIEDIYSVRKALEVLSVEWAVQRISEGELNQLKEICELMEFYTVKKDSKKVLEINTEFHNVLYSATRSRFMAQVLRSYKGYIEQTRKAIVYKEEYLNEILEEHTRVLDAIIDGNVEEAKVAMADHLDGSKRRAEVTYLK